MSRKATRHVGRQPVHREGFALRLHEALREDNLTAEQFAFRVGKTLRTVHRWRNGETEPSAEDVSLIAKTLKRDPDWFYDEDVAA